MSASRFMEIAVNGQKFATIKIILEELYSWEAAHGSRFQLFWSGLRDGLITQLEFDNARKYYGPLWTHIGD